MTVSYAEPDLLNQAIYVIYSGLSPARVCPDNHLDMCYLLLSRALVFLIGLLIPEATAGSCISQPGRAGTLLFTP